jgi:hypothetical protein
VSPEALGSRRETRPSARASLAVAIEALKLYRESAAFDVNQILACARVCRAETIMRPYLEALL